MTLPMVTCPLCCRPGFSTSDSLCAALVGVTTRKLCCPICNEILLGLDKFTIHLFSHSLKKFGFPTFKEPAQVAPSPANSQICNNSNNNSHSKSVKKAIVDDLNKPKQLNNNLNHVELTYKTPDKIDWKINNTNLQMENTKKVLNCQENPLIYFRADNGQIFALTHEALGTSLKNVTINTQNYITNTNITTSTVQTNVVEKVQKRKYNQVVDKTVAEVKEAQVVEGSGDSEVSFQPCSSIRQEEIKSSATREFESCRDLLTKGDFSTCTDDLMEVCSSDKEAPQQSVETISNESEGETKKVDEGEQKVVKDNVTCEICSFVFPNKTILAMHKQLIHKKVEVEPESKRKLFLCNICPKSFKMRGSLMLHRRVAHTGGFNNQDNSESSKQPPPKPACQVCGKFFKKEIHLSQHMKAHDEKQWQCTICAKTFTTKYFLKKHRRLHTGEMPYRCNTCSKAFTFQQSYHKHLLYHSDDKPYCCAQCGRLFKELSTLHNHERIHSGEKPFTCETCGKAFRQRVSYLVHRRIHTGAMPYKCTACNKSFRYKVSERTHKCTAQPPGVVVRTQSNLVERLQAAMIKAAEKGDKKETSESMSEEGEIVEKTQTVPSPRSCGKKFDKKTSPGRDMTESEKAGPKDRPHYYLLVKGPNEESYYQPVVVPATNLTPLPNKKEPHPKDSRSKCQKLSKNENITESLRRTTELDQTNRLLGESQSSKEEATFHIVIKASESTHPSDDGRSLAFLNSPTDSNQTFNRDMDYSNFLTSPKEKNNRNESDVLAMLVEPQKTDSYQTMTQDDRNDFSPKCKSVSPETEYPSGYSVDLVNSASEEVKQLDLLNIEHTNGNMDANCNNLTKDSLKESDAINQTVDAMMDSDIFSLILSPALSSPSDKFGKLTLSPSSNSASTWNVCSFDKQHMLSDNFQTDLDMDHDPLFDNISDDALKEFLFGSEHCA